MKIAVSAVEPRWESMIDPRFGRCPYFLIVNTDDLSMEAVSNAAAALGQGAGIQAARLVAEHGVQAVLTGHCGPNAQQALAAAGIRIVEGCSGVARQVVEQFQAGQLGSPTGTGATAGGAAAMAAGGSSVPSMTPGQPLPGVPLGLGLGWGRRRRTGRAGGMGRGRGMGFGRGMGLGFGRGVGGGWGRRANWF